MTHSGTGLLRFCNLRRLSARVNDFVRCKQAGCAAVSQ
jgi:hypothetical protein